MPRDMLATRFHASEAGAAVLAQREFEKWSADYWNDICSTVSDLNEGKIAGDRISYGQKGYPLSIAAGSVATTSGSSQFSNIEVGAQLSFGTASTYTVWKVSGATLHLLTNVASNQYASTNDSNWWITNPTKDLKRRQIGDGISGVKWSALTQSATSTTNVVSAVSIIIDQLSARAKPLFSAMLEMRDHLSAWGLVRSG